MNIQVIKSNQKRSKKLSKIFLNDNLDYVTQTCDVTLQEFKKLWAATGGFSNSDCNYLFAADEANCWLQKDDDGKTTWFFGGHELSTTITPKKSDELHENFTVVYRRQYAYGNKNSGIRVAARRSKCGNYVTVFRSELKDLISNYVELSNELCDKINNSF